MLIKATIQLSLIARSSPKNASLGFICFYCDDSAVAHNAFFSEERIARLHLLLLRSLASRALSERPVPAKPPQTAANSAENTRIWRILCYN
jgi:hypothetical protein